MVCLLYLTERKEKESISELKWWPMRAAHTCTLDAEKHVYLSHLSTFFTWLHQIFFLKTQGIWGVLLLFSQPTRCWCPFIPSLSWHSINTCCPCKVWTQEGYKFGLQWLDLSIFGCISETEGFLLTFFSVLSAFFLCVWAHNAPMLYLFK